MLLKGIDKKTQEKLLALSKKLRVNFPENLILNYKKSDSFSVKKEATNIEITYSSVSELYRSLLLSAQLVDNNNNGELREVSQFASKGVMLDMSRCGVMTVDMVKEYIEYMALMGLNSLMLYMEDVFKVDEYPYFGYMRGRYSKEELKEINDFGNEYGVEIIPCIQTLGHFEQYIKWFEGKENSDTITVMMAECEEIYIFIENLIKTVSECFTTKKIHIGMDEAWGLGSGNYLKKNGYKNPTDILSDHIIKVKEITDKYGLEPMIWSDMYFRLASKTGAYYDMEAKVPDYVSKIIPENLSIVYWDYYHKDKEIYRHMIKEHKKITDRVVFAGGIWLWAGLLPDFRHSFEIADAGLLVCKEYGINDVYATIWGDDGCETDGRFSLAGCVIYGEHSYNENVNKDDFNHRMKLLFGVEVDELKEISKALYPDAEYSQEKSILSIKQIVYNDLLCGLVDKEIVNKGLSEYYLKLHKKFSDISKKESYYTAHFEYTKTLCALAALKCEITDLLYKGYEASDKEIIKNLVDVKLPQLEVLFEKVKMLHCRLWHSTYKPFGFEIVDGRYSMKIGRIKTAILRLSQYINGEINRLPELEEERLDFNNQHYLANWHTGITSAYMTRGY